MNIMTFTGNVTDQMKKDPIKKLVRKDYIRAARELGYSDEVIAKLSEAKTEIECDHIMHKARCADNV